MFDKNKVKLGIAPIAWTNDDLPDLGAENTFEQCVSEMALAGFTGSEVGNKYPKDPVELKKALDLRWNRNLQSVVFIFPDHKTIRGSRKRIPYTVRVLKSNGSKSDRSF